MNMHAVRRILLAAALVLLIAMGVAHPGNEPLRPAMGFAAFGALFMLGTVGLGLYFEAGRSVFQRLGRFLGHSEVASQMGGIFVLALGGLGIISWSEMSLLQQVAFACTVIIGALAAFWEHMVDVKPDGTNPHQG